MAQKFSLNPSSQVFLFALLFSVFIIIASFVLPWKTINWGQVSMGYTPTITVSGEAKDDQMNQIATFSAGISALNDDKQAAVDEVNTKIQEITKIVKNLEIDEKDIKTQNINIYQQQDYYTENGVQKSKNGQWNVNNTIEIKLRDLTKIDTLTDALAKSPANNIWGPNLQVDDSTVLGNDLLAKAIEDARTKAEKIAKSSGNKLGKILNIVEGSSSSYPIYPQMKAMDSLSSTQIGSTTIEKTVTVTFELK